MELHIVENIPSITRRAAERHRQALDRELSTRHASADGDNQFEAWLLELCAYHESAYRRFAPRKELLKRLLQAQFRSATLEEIGQVQRQCGSGGSDPWPISVLVEGKRVVLPIDLSNWGELFEVDEAGIGPEKLLQAKIESDLSDGRLNTAYDE